MSHATIGRPTIVASFDVQGLEDGLIAGLRCTRRWKPAPLRTRHGICHCLLCHLNLRQQECLQWLH
jgi:hypothetical protein